MNLTTKLIALFICSMSFCSCSENKPIKQIKEEITTPKSSLAELNKNQSKSIPTWDGRIKGCKTKQ